MHSHQADKLGSGPKFGSGKASLAQDFPPRNATLLMMSFSTCMESAPITRTSAKIPGDFAWKTVWKGFQFYPKHSASKKELHQENPPVMVPGPMSEKFRCAVAAYCGLSRGQFSAGENVQGPQKGFLMIDSTFSVFGHGPEQDEVCAVMDRKFPGLTRNSQRSAMKMAASSPCHGSRFMVALRAMPFLLRRFLDPHSVCWDFI